MNKKIIFILLLISIFLIIGSSTLIAPATTNCNFISQNDFEIQTNKCNYNCLQLNQINKTIIDMQWIKVNITDLQDTKPIINLTSLADLDTEEYIIQLRDKQNSSLWINLTFDDYSITDKKIKKLKGYKLDKGVNEFRYKFLPKNCSSKKFDINLETERGLVSLDPWYDVADGYSTAGSGNNDPYGITWNGSYFFVVDYTDAKVYCYTKQGVYTSGCDFNTNTNSDGITTNGSDFWVTENVINSVRHYSIIGTDLGSFALAGGNNVPQGIATNDSTLFVSDGLNNYCYIYSKSGSYKTSFACDKLGAISSIATNSSDLFVLTQNGVNIHDYNYSSTWLSNISLQEIIGTSDTYGLTTNLTYPKDFATGSHTPYDFWITDKTDDYVYHISTQSPAGNTPPDILFIYQDPSDIDVFDILNRELNITYNISDNIMVDASSVKLWYAVNTTLNPNSYWYLVNGTPGKGFWTSEGVNIANSSTLFNFTLEDMSVYPAIYNYNETFMRSTPKLPYDLDSQNKYIKIRLWNVSTAFNYSIFEINAQNKTATTNPLRIYYCNSSYSTGNPTTSRNCVNFYNLNSASPYNHTHHSPYDGLIYSGHHNIPFTINSSSQSILGVKVTSTSYFLLRGVNSATNFWNVSYIQNVSENSTIRVTTNAGNSWSDFGGTVDTHLHQYNGKDTFMYYVYACDNQASCTNGTIRTDLIDLKGLPPIINVYNPKEAKYNTTVVINYTAESPNLYPLTLFNISLVNTDYSFNRTINTNNSGNYGFIFESRNVTRGEYFIRVQVCDNSSQCSYGYSENITINNFPSISGSLSPRPAYTNTSYLNFSYNLYDTNLDNITGVFEWMNNSVKLYTTRFNMINGSFNSTNLSLASFGYHKGNNITINYTIFDEWDSIYNETSINISNTIPSIPHINSPPNRTYVTPSLTMQVNASTDIDGDLIHYFFNYGTNQLTTTRFQDNSSMNASKMGMTRGVLYYWRVDAFDNETIHTINSTISTFIINKLPENATNISIINEFQSTTINTTDILNCTTIVLNNDNLGSPNQKINTTLYIYNGTILYKTYFRNDLDNGTFISWGLNDTFKGLQNKGENWSCGITLFDSLEYSKFLSSNSSVTISNSQPPIPNLFYPANNSILLGNQSINLIMNDVLDIDGDPVNYTFYLSSTTPPTPDTFILYQSNSSNITNGLIPRGSRIYILVNTFDGTIHSDNSTIYNVEGNSLPYFGGDNINIKNQFGDANINTTDIINCTAIVQDADNAAYILFPNLYWGNYLQNITATLYIYNGTTLYKTYQKTNLNYSMEISWGLNDSLKGIQANNELWSCGGTLHDTMEFSSPLEITSTQVNISTSNFAPVINYNSTFPALLRHGMTFYLTTNISDANGDAIRYVNFTIESPNGVQVLDRVNGTYTGTFAGSTEWNSTSWTMQNSSDNLGIWKWNYTLTDGTIIINKWGEFEINNTNPNFTLALTPMQPNANEMVNASGTVSDDDNDILTATFNWFKNGILFWTQKFINVVSGTFLSSNITTDGYGNVYNVTVNISDSIEDNISSLAISSIPFLNITSIINDSSRTTTYGACVGDPIPIEYTYISSVSNNCFYSIRLPNGSIDSNYINVSIVCGQNTTFASSGCTGSSDKYSVFVYFNDSYNNLIYTSTSFALTYSALPGGTGGDGGGGEVTPPVEPPVECTGTLLSDGTCIPRECPDTGIPSPTICNINEVPNCVSYSEQDGCPVCSGGWVCTPSVCPSIETPTCPLGFGLSSGRDPMTNCIINYQCVNPFDIPKSAGGGGDGKPGDEARPYICKDGTTDILIQTETGAGGYSFYGLQGTTRILDFYAINNGIEEKTFLFQIWANDSSASWVKLSENKITMPANKYLNKKLTMNVSIPENAKNGLYYPVIIAFDSSGKCKQGNFPNQLMVGGFLSKIYLFFNKLFRSRYVFDIGIPLFFILLFWTAITDLLFLLIFTITNRKIYKEEKIPLPVAHLIAFIVFIILWVIL